MGGNKHKNGIVCMFPGCEKTMRTQKFKLHFTKQHLKPGEVYSVEHRRRFEVARDEEYTSDAATPTHKLEQQHLAAMSVQISETYQQQVAAAAAVAASSAAAAVAGGGSTGLTPTFTPIASSAADVTTAESVAESAAAAAKEQLDAAHSQALLIEEAVNQQAQLLEEQQRLNRLTQQSRPADARFGCTPSPATASATTTANSLISPSPNKRPVSALESASVEAPSLATTSIPQGQDPSRAVLVQYIEMMDQRFHELIQKMSQVIDGQRELIDMLRRPFPADTAHLLDQTPSLSSSPNDDDGSAKKRRKLHAGAEQTQQQANGTAQRPSNSTTTVVAAPTSALL